MNNSHAPSAVSAAKFGQQAAIAGQINLSMQYDSQVSNSGTIFNRDQIVEVPDSVPLIHGLIEKGKLTMIAGPSGCGKSVLQLHLCAALCNAQSVLGHAVPTPARFLYINLEGELKRRLRAVESYHEGWSFPLAQALFRTLSLQLTDSQAVELLIREIELLGGTDVIFIDTLNRAMEGGDENSSSDMGKIITNAHTLIKRTGAAVVLTHHTGKTKERGPRGHSSLFAALDTCLMVDKGESGVRTVELTKTRDGQDGLKRYFQIEGVILGEDQFGLPISAPVLKELEATPEMVRFAQTRPLSENHQDALLTITLQLNERKTLPEEEALSIVKGLFADRFETKHRSTRAKDAIKTLIDVGRLKLEGGAIGLPE